jgi:hypothetical protein
MTGGNNIHITKYVHLDIDLEVNLFLIISYGIILYAILGAIILFS